MIYIFYQNTRHSKVNSAGLVYFDYKIKLQPTHNMLHLMKENLEKIHYSH